ncbi:MAG: hypothetical protein OEY28_12765 [Nitrospira sp.]|nr:hypothetical protein [Nitrospira sp.]
MNKVIPLLLPVVFGLTACPGGDEADKKTSPSTIAPMRAIDEAYKTEAVAAGSRLSSQMRVALIRSYSNDVSKLAADISGVMTPQKLEKIGMSPLDGNHYRTSDYRLTHNGGGSFTLEAGAQGSPTFYTVPITVQ